MSEKVNIEVVCEGHPAERLTVTTEKRTNGLRLLVAPCGQCLVSAIETAVEPEPPELVFNDSVLTSITLEP